ncbi:PEP-CTERM sorting domain-containing protein [Marinobacter zhejiangensis]|nr:PEP-CTERM sorting domain-containing protein [Marinobacter zhejiangensis]
MHKILLGATACAGLLLFGSASMAGAIHCQSLSDQACDQPAQPYSRHSFGQYPVINQWSDHGVFSALSDNSPGFHRMNWGHVLNHARALHLFLFDDARVIVDKPNDEPYAIDDGQTPAISITEPGTLALFGLGLLAIGVIHLRHKSHPPQ